MGIHRLFLQAASSARMLKTQCHHSMTVLFFNGMPPHDRVRTPGSKWQDMKQYPAPTNGAGVPDKEAEASPSRAS